MLPNLIMVQDMINNLINENIVIKPIKKEGLQQGASTSGDLYSIGIHPLNEQLHQIAITDPAGTLAAYMDDVKVHSSFLSVMEIIKTQLRDGPKYGAKMKMAKQKIFLGRCPTLSIAQAQKAALIALSIPADRIHIHPDNLPLDQQVDAKRHFGEMLIGIPVSPFPEYIDAQLDAIIQDFEEEVEKRLIPRLDSRPQLLHYIFSETYYTAQIYSFAPRFAAPVFGSFDRLPHSTPEGNFSSTFRCTRVQRPFVRLGTNPGRLWSPLGRGHLGPCLRSLDDSFNGGN